MGPRRPPMRAALRRCRKGRMTGSDWREPVRTHVSLGTSMPKITGILKIYPPQRSAGGVWETRSKAEGFPHGTFQGAQRACGCGKPPNEMVWDGASSPGFSMAASRPLGWGRTCPLASVPDMPVRKVSIRRWMARMAEKEPIRVRMGSGISGLSLKVVNRWYGRRSACARGATPCGLAGFAPTFQYKDRGSFSVAPQEFARGRETPWLGRFAGLAFFNVSMKAGGRPQDLPVRCSTGGSTESGTERCGIARRRRTPGWRSCSSRGSRRCSSGP